MANKSFTQVSDRELLEHAVSAAADARTTIVELIELLGEIDVRRLYLPEGCSSLFTYCTQVLRFSEDEAYHRIAAARAARSFPIVLDRLREGTLTLTAVTLLRPHLTPENAESLIANAINKSKREVEHQMACVAPKPDAPSLVRRLPDPAPKSISADAVQKTVTDVAAPSLAAPLEPPLQTPPPRPLSVPLSSDRFLLRVTLSAEAHAKLRRAQDLLRHSIPNGDPAVVVDRALALLVDDLERRKLANVRKPRTPAANSTRPDDSSRYVPASVRRDVWMRDRSRCAFIGIWGRCTETGQLELHHLEPFACGGPTTVENLELRCRAHNQYEGALLFGEEWRDLSTGPGPS